MGRTETQMCLVWHETMLQTRGTRKARRWSHPRRLDHLYVAESLRKDGASVRREPGRTLKGRVGGSQLTKCWRNLLYYSCTSSSIMRISTVPQTGLLSLSCVQIYKNHSVHVLIQKVQTRLPSSHKNVGIVNSQYIGHQPVHGCHDIVVGC
ncbi:hypothetical protein BKA93DRAFT_523941 [Sparassis latifolia]